MFLERSYISKSDRIPEIGKCPENDQVLKRVRCLTIFRRGVSEELLIQNGIEPRKTWAAGFGPRSRLERL